MQENEADEALMHRVQSGNQGAYRVLVQRHAARYHSLIYRYTQNSALTDDVLQEAFVKLWTKPHLFDGSKAKFTTWFHRVCVNGALDEGRRKRFEAIPEDFDVASHDIAADEQIIQDQTAQHVRTLVKKLPPRQRMAVTLSYLEDMSNKAGAAAMDIKLKAFESLLARARKSLQSKLNQDLNR